MPGTVDFELSQGVGTITIRRPQSRNALTWSAMEAFAASVEEAHQAAGLAALIVTGEGGAFCAGGDLVELNDYPTLMDGVRLSAVMAAALDRVEALPFPTIAAIEGPALGGGAEIALACDLRVMAESATFGMMHARLGLTPAWGGGQRLLRTVGYARALEWLAAGRVLSASDGLAMGVIQRVTPDGEAFEAAMRLAKTIAANDRGAVLAAKRIVQAGVRLPLEEAMRQERGEFPDLWAAPAHLDASAAFVARHNHRPRRADSAPRGGAAGR